MPLNIWNFHDYHKSLYRLSQMQSSTLLLTTDFSCTLSVSNITQAYESQCYKINPECSREGQIQYFGPLMRRKDSLEKPLMLGKCEGKRRRGQQRTRWLGSVIEAIKMNLTQRWLLFPFCLFLVGHGSSAPATMANKPQQERKRQGKEREGTNDRPSRLTDGQV